MKKVVLIVAVLLLVYAVAATVAANRHAAVEPSENRLVSRTEVKSAPVPADTGHITDLFREMEEASARGDYREAMRLAEEIRLATDAFRSR